MQLKIPHYCNSISLPNINKDFKITKIHLKHKHHEMFTHCYITLFFINCHLKICCSHVFFNHLLPANKCKNLSLLCQLKQEFASFLSRDGAHITNVRNTEKYFRPIYIVYTCLQSCHGTQNSR